MVYRRRIIPLGSSNDGASQPNCACLCPKRVVFLHALRCELASATDGVALLSLYPVGHPPAPARSLVEWVASTDSRALRVAEINRIDGLHDQLLRLPHVSASDFHPGATPGSIVDGVRSEDLTRLTYADASFDLVLTSETLEHVPDLKVALGEIHRVLVPGGRHIFTIPQLPHVPATFARSVVLSDGSIEDR